MKLMVFSADKKSQVDVGSAYTVSDFGVRSKMRNKVCIKIESLVFYEVNAR